VDVGPAYPTISLTSPQSYSFARGTTQITATTTSADNPATVQIAVDGSTVPSTTSGSSVSAAWDTTKVSDGTHTITATITDARSETATSSETVTVDNTPPTTSILAPLAGSFATGTLAAQAHASDAYGIKSVQFAIDGTPVGNALTSPDTSGGYTYSSSLNLSGLTSGSHTLTDIATDNAGNTTTSSGVGFTIGYAPPTVSITSPLAWSFAHGTVAVTAGVTGGTPPDSVQLLVDGKASGSAQTSGYSFNWSTTGLADGSHTLAATVTDSQGRTSTSSPITVTVDNTAPTTYILAPVAGNYFQTTLPVQAHASDAYGVKSVQFEIDGVPVGSAVTSPTTTGGYTYAASLAISNLSNGPHTLTDIATDNAGNTTTSASVAFFVGVGPPTVAMTAPINYTFASKTLTVTATATGGTAPYTGKLLVDGVATTVVPTVLGSTLTFQWNTVGTPDGSHTLAVQVTDAALATATSTVVNVTVDNTAPEAIMYLPTPLAGYTYARDNGPTTFQVHASDANGVKSVQFTVDGNPVGALLTQPDTAGTYLYSISFDTSTLTPGMHNVSAIVTDNAGNTTAAAPLAIKTGAIVYVPVLNYHGIEGPLDSEPDIYDQTSTEASQQLAYLKANGYQSITIAQYETWLKTNTLPAGITKPVLITVDDGLTDEEAWDPLLKQYGYTAVLYVVTGFADNLTPGSDDPTGNMSWKEIQSLAANGRWQIAFHAGEYGHGDYSEAENTIKLSSTQTLSFSPTCFEYYNCLGTVTTTTTTGSGRTKKTTTTTAPETPAQMESRIEAEVTAGRAELRKEVPSSDTTTWACPWNACGQWTNFYNDPSGTIQSWFPGYFASLFQIVWTQTDPVTYGLASGTVGALNAYNRHYRFEVHTDTTLAEFEAALTDPAFANN
jgi:Bacterial Ig domain